MNPKIENLKGKLIVSCQTLPEEPLHSSFIMGRIAFAENQNDTGMLGAFYHFCRVHPENEKTALRTEAEDCLKHQQLND